MYLASPSSRKPCLSLHFLRPEVMESVSASPSTSFNYSPISSSSSSSSSSTSFSVYSYSVWGGRGRERESETERESSVVSEMVGKVICGIITCVFAIVGSFVGAVTGALIGLATESGFFRGAGIGAISGAVFSIEAVESSFALWQSRSGIRSLLYVINIICSLLSGRLVREKVGPAIQSAVQSQMSAADLPFVEATDFFETGGTRGMSKDSVNKIPKIKITKENTMDASGEKACCSVCLQDFLTGETARSLPHCHHMFHLPCIDSWLIRHGSCPLCRRDI